MLTRGQCTDSGISPLNPHTVVNICVSRPEITYDSQFSGFIAESFGQFKGTMPAAQRLNDFVANFAWRLLPLCAEPSQDH